MIGAIFGAIVFFVAMAAIIATVIIDYKAKSKDFDELIKTTRMIRAQDEKDKVGIFAPPPTIEEMRAKRGN